MKVPATGHPPDDLDLLAGGDGRFDEEQPVQGAAVGDAAHHLVSDDGRRRPATRPTVGNIREVTEGDCVLHRAGGHSRTGRRVGARREQYEECRRDPPKPQMSAVSAATARFC